MRTFETGATRDTDAGKLDYEGFLSPLALKRFAEYMNKNRVQRDGQIRDSDNWQKGIPRTAYMKSLWRHFFDLWELHREWLKCGNYLTLEQEDLLEESLAACYFNIQGYLHEHMKTKRESMRSQLLHAAAEDITDPDPDYQPDTRPVGEGDLPRSEWFDPYPFRG